MRYSACARYGFLRYCGNVKPEPQLQYEAAVAQLGKALDLTPGMPSSADNEAEVFANAYQRARVVATLRKAGYQRDVTKVSDLIAQKEADFQVTPLPTDTLWTRQQRLLALKALPLGASAQNLTNALTATLGASFVGLRVLSLTTIDEAVANLNPTNFQALNLVGKWLQLTAPVGGPGIIGSFPQWASYGNLDPSIPDVNTLAVGDAVCMQAENSATGEVVSVLAIQTLTDGTLQFSALFTQAHDAGSTMTTSSIPRWTSTQALLLVEVTQAASINPVQRAQVDNLMQRICRGVTQWATVWDNAGALGPFKVGVTPLGTATVGATAA